MSARVLAAVWVPGVPRTKGSLDRRMQDTPQSKAWRSLVAAELRRYLRAAPPYWLDGPQTFNDPAAVPYPGPVAVRCIFVRGDGVGDIDKLARNVLDALTDSGVIGDDAQVVKLYCDRLNACAGRNDGAFVLVATVDEESSLLPYSAEIEGLVGR